MRESHPLPHPPPRLRPLDRCGHGDCRFLCFLNHRGSPPLHLFSSFSRSFLSASVATALPVEFRMPRFTGVIAIERLLSSNEHYMQLSLVKDSEEESVLNPRFESRRPHHSATFLNNAVQRTSEISSPVASRCSGYWLRPRVEVSSAFRKSRSLSAVSRTRNITMQIPSIKTSDMILKKDGASM